MAYGQTSAAGENQSRIQGLTVQAQSSSRDLENETVDLSGKVQLIYQDQHLSADRAHVNLRAKTIEASGNVTVTTPQANISGQKVIMDYESNTGLIIDGFVQSGNVLFEGNQIQKLSESDYIADNARYTTCTTCPEAWSFSGSRIRAEMGGYAYIKNSVMRVAGVPVLYLPYLLVPLKSDRQSGLLTPELALSQSGGLTFSESYFWVISRSQDATVGLTNYELRGLKTLLNYRYVLNPSSKGELDFGYLRDRVFSDESRLNSFRPLSAQGQAVNRYFLRYNHYYEMPDDFIHRAQLNNASDLQYPKDFPMETANHGDSSLENRSSITKNTVNQHYNLDASYYKNLIQSDPLAGNEDSVHRLPELRFSQTASKLGSSDFLASFDFDYVNFARANSAFDNLNSGYMGTTTNRYLKASGVSCATPDWEKNPACEANRDSRFDPSKDLIRTGQRLDFQPTLARPIKLQNLELLPQISYRETDYTFPVGTESHNSRRYLRTSISARSTFSRIYGDFNSLQSERVKHEIQPEISFTNIPWLDHPHHTFFGDSSSEESPFAVTDAVSDKDLNGPASLQFDYNDRLYDRKLLTVGVSNKLTRKSWENGTPIYLQFLSWKLAQAYDIYLSERNPNGEPLKGLISELRITLPNLAIYQNSLYKPYQKVTNTTSRVRLLNLQGDFFQIEHVLTFEGSANQDVGDRTENFTYMFKKGISWLDLIAKFTYSPKPSQGDYLKSWGYGAQFRLPGDCLYVGVSHYRVPGGDTNFMLSANFIWDGATKPPLTEELITKFGL